MFKSFAFLIFTLFLFTSCANRKKLIYFQEPVPANAEKDMNYSPIFKKDDLISIVVSSSNAEATIPFNLMVPSAGDAGHSTIGFLIDENGDVNYPFLGKIHLQGLTRSQAIQLMEEKLKPYLDKPIVQMHIENFKITLLGDFAKPGNYQIPNERITLLEAIGLGGDLSVTGIRKNIKVIRDRNGKRTEYIVDLTKTDVFNSEVYYLEQNDIIYIEPNQTKLAASVLNPAIAYVFSLTTLIVTSLSIILR